MKNWWPKKFTRQEAKDLIEIEQQRIGQGPSSDPGPDLLWTRITFDGELVFESEEELDE